MREKWWSWPGAVQLLLGHRKLESTVRYLGIELEDALDLAEQIDIGGCGQATKEGPLPEWAITGQQRTFASIPRLRQSKARVMAAQDYLEAFPFR